MRRGAVGITLAACLAGRPVQAGAAEVTSLQVRQAIQRGVDFLRREQLADGSWRSVYSGAYPAGATALATLALLTAGLPADDPCVAKALQNLRVVRPEETYTVALMAMVFATAEPDRDKLVLTELAEWLQRMQIVRGPNVGMWHYGQRGGAGDHSNTQYALLGLKEAAEADVRIRSEVWERARQHWLQTQNADGSWSYGGRGPGTGTGSMTVAGVASLIITGLDLHASLERVGAGGEITNCGQFRENVPLAKGIAWIAQNFSVDFNPRSGPAWYYYYMYGLERAGRLTGRRFFGVHDWYREGAAALLQRQSADGSWGGRGWTEDPVVATSFALLFLAKGRWPVLINQITWEGAWRNNHLDVRNLTAEVGRVWKQPLTWQAVAVARARVEDLLQAPICYFNGPVAPELTAGDIAKLREYVLQGGFILADARCGRADFDRWFRQMVKEMFPEPHLKLRPLEADHPIWRAEYDLKADHPLEGIDVGCRTSVVYSPKDLGCHWAVGKQAVTNRAFRLGVNICAYATGKENLLDKLETRVLVDLRQRDKVKRDAVELAKLRHGGGWNVAGLAVPNLMAWLREHANLDVVLEPRELAVPDPNLRKYPLAFMEGRSRFTLSAEDRQALADYLHNGGFLMANAVCGSAAFDESFRELMQQVLPQAKLQRLPVDHPLFTQTPPYRIERVRYTRGVDPGLSTPYLEGIEHEGELVVVYSKYDLSCALERHPTFGCPGYSTEDAFRVASNIVMYVLTH